MKFFSRKSAGIFVISMTFLFAGVIFSFESHADDSNEKIVVSFNNTDIVDVIRWASDLTEKNIIISEAIKNKRVTVIPGDPMTKKEAFEVFLSILQVNGLAIVETEDSIKIFTAQDVKSNAIPLIDDGKVSGEEVVIRIVKIKNIAAQQLVALLRPLVPPTAGFEVHTDTNILLIADNRFNIEKIIKLVDQIDKAGTIDIEVISLKHASAKDVVELVSTLVPKIVSAGKDGAVAPTQALHFAADERSNSILMSGDPVLRTQIRKLIERIDQPLAGEGNTQVFHLNYADAKDMVEILEKVSGAVISVDKDQKQTSSSGKASIVASEANNALVITAPPSMLNTMKGVIERLDVRREQVLVEALLVEVSEDVGRELGSIWFSDPLTAGSSGSQVGGTFDPAPSITITPATATTPETITNTGGILAAYFRAGDLRGVLSALETMTDSNVLSTPTIMALDNEEAEILVGENVPFKTGEQNSTNAADNDFVQIERQDIGIHLKVKPKINLNDTLTLEIEQKVESIKDKAVAGASDIVTNKRELKTKAVVKDNEILVLGGLIRDESQEIETKVPFLGDIPIIGWLFKGTKKVMVKNNLMVFIHPKILRSNEDGRKVSLDKYQKMRTLEEIYNDNTDWLTIRRNDLPLLEKIPDEVLNPDAYLTKDALNKSNQDASGNSR